MKLRTLINRMTVRVMLLLAGAIVLSVMLVSLTLNVRFGRFFAGYLEAEQNYQVEQLLEAVEAIYHQNHAWTGSALRSLSASPYVTPFDLVLRDASGRVILTVLRDTGMMTMQHRMMGQMHGAMRMRPPVSGDYQTELFSLTHESRPIGTLEVGYDGPFLPSERDLLFLNSINQSILLAALAGLLITLLLGYLLSKRMMAPLNTLAAFSHDIGRGKLHPSIELDTRVTEWQELAAALSRLSSSLKEQEALRIRLTADVSHELRTPVAVLQSHLEAFQDGVWEATPERLAVCRQETERLTSLIQQLQQLASLEAVEAAINPVQFSLDEELKSLCLAMNPAFEQKNIRLEWQLSSPVTIEADREKVHQLASNLLTNALKYTDAGGRVTLQLDADDREASLLVTDTGIGIPEEDQPHIFERFYRADQSRSRRSGGAGIGLALVKALVEAHGGQISAASQLGEGAAFQVVLPLKQSW